MVDGQENPYDNIAGAQILRGAEVPLEHRPLLRLVIGYVINKKAFDKLNPDQQKAVREALAIAITEQRAISERENKTAREGLIKGGMIYTELSPAEIAKIREATKPVYAEMCKKRSARHGRRSSPKRRSSAASDPRR